MKFILFTSQQIYTSEEAEELKKLGFTFRKAPGYFEGALFINGQPSIDISSIEELIELSKQLECPLIIDYRNDYLEIYNDYRE
jgi:hypothetical protein